MTTAVDEFSLSHGGATLPVHINPRTADVDARAVNGDARSTILKRRADPSIPHMITVAAARSPYLTLRALADRLAALVMLIAAAPVIGLSALLVKLTSRGPAFYTQTRLGLRGRLFTIYKLRTMIHNCES